jgi:hypothetical protein
MIVKSRNIEIKKLNYNMDTRIGLFGMLRTGITFEPVSAEPRS